ncbi:MAG: hypothetical protein WBA28_05260 [Microbacteriaceae bacterium]
MAKNIILWASGIVFIAFGLVWQLIRTADFYQDWARDNDFLGPLGVVLGWAFLVAGVGIIVKALVNTKENPKESAK